MKGFATGMESWEGHQKNRLLMNRQGREFVNVAFLLGVADSFDSRSALSEDLDLDGRVDLIVVEDRGLKGQKLHVHRNQLETGNAWIGIQLREEGRGVSPVGASVVVRTAEQTHVGRVFTGETIMGQNSTTLHFGLGASSRGRRAGDPLGRRQGADPPQSGDQSLPLRGGAGRCALTRAARRATRGRIGR